MTVPPADPYMTCYASDRAMAENAFRGREPDLSIPPSWEASRGLLPRPHWPARPNVLACWNRTWELYWTNLRAVTPGIGFVAPFIDTAFNGNLFMWDSVFILRYGRYAARAFEAQRTLDNLYARQHPDGFISREIDWTTGIERFHRHEPGSTGPNLLAWCEWEHWRDTGDRERLAAVFMPILNYHRWMRDYRTWQDGTYWSTGWGCGMDNQPRLDTDLHVCHHHSGMSWIDTTAQALLSGRTLLQMAKVLGREADVRDVAAEIPRLEMSINQTMWNDEVGCYVDRRRDGRVSDVVSIAGFWTLLAGSTPPERRARMIALLRDERHFNRPHRVPTLSASHPAYDPDGGYWLGGVWPPTTAMILAALRGEGEDALAHEIGLNHLDNVVKVFSDTGTVWENYAPESAIPGKPSRPDFTGWGGLGPVAVLIEEVFGLRLDVPARRLVWDLRLTDEHGIAALPFGNACTVDVRVAARANVTDEPQIAAHASGPLTLEVRWQGGRKELQLG